MKKKLKNYEVLVYLKSLKPLLARRDKIGYVAARNYRFLSNSIVEFDTIRLSLIEKYGVVPKTAYPESKSSSASREMDATLTEKLREDACILRKLHGEGQTLDALRTRKAEMLNEVYRLLCICLGEPPKTFTFEYRDADDHFHRETGLTPKRFFEKYVGVDLSDYVSLINAPTADKPYGRSYTVRYLGNVKEGRPVRYRHLPIEELKKAAIAQMQDGQPVWFGCDVGKCSERDSGIMDLDIRSLEDLLDTRFTMTKAERLDYGQSLMTHAMVFQGVNLDENGKPNRWRVENSWGKEPGKDGYYLRHGQTPSRGEFRQRIEPCHDACGRRPRCRRAAEEVDGGEQLGAVERLQGASDHDRPLVR